MILIIVVPAGLRKQNCTGHGPCLPRTSESSTRAEQRDWDKCWSEDREFQLDKRNKFKRSRAHYSGYL